MRTRKLIFLTCALLIAALAGIWHVRIALPSHAEMPHILSAALLSTLTASSTTLYPVSRVVDGDTLVVSMGGANITVRLIGLDTPEVVDPRKPVQCFGKEASAHAKERLNGTSVRLELDPSQDTYDKYGRLLAYVFLPDGTLFNKQMIEEGYGHEYTYHIPYRYQAAFKAAEQDARIHARGLWAADTCNGETS